MASPSVISSGSRTLDPHKKGHFNLQLSHRITKPNKSSKRYSAVKFNHKPQQNSESRETTLKSGSDGQFTLKLRDRDEDDTSKYTFQGHRASSKKSYVLIFDPSKQTCTLEPLSASYTFNLKSAPSTSSSQIVQQYPKIQQDDAHEDLDDLFGGSRSEAGSDSEPDNDNPYDYRHFMKERKRGDESDFMPSSPDFRNGSAANTPSMQARKPGVGASKLGTSTSAQSKPLPQTRKRKSPEPAPRPSASSASTIKKPNPTVRLDRRASTRPNDSSSNTTKSNRKAPAPKPPASKIKSAEIIHSSDESDIDVPSSPPKPQPSHSDSEEDDDRATALTIEVPDERPARRNGKGALASLGLGQNLGFGGHGFLKSPSNGPISLHSAANSVEGSPDARAVTPLNLRKNVHKRADEDEDVIDFGDFGHGKEDSDDEDMGYVEDDEDENAEAEVEADRDVEPMDIGPPATSTPAPPQPVTRGQRMSVSGLGIDSADAEYEEDEDADFAAELMQGLVSQEEEERLGLGVDSESEESEEE